MSETASGIWSRLLASLRPAPDEAPMIDHARGMSLREVAVRFWPRLRPLRWWLVLALMLMAVAPLIEIVEIMLFERLVDDVLVPAQWRPLVWLAVSYIGLNLLSAIVSGCDDVVSTWISNRFLLDLRTDVFRHVLSLPPQVHERRRLGDVMSRLTSDVAAVESFMVGNLGAALDATLRLLFFAAALLFLQWELALASFVVIPALWWISTRFATFVKRLSRERRRRSGSLSAVTEEHLANAALVQAYNRQDQAVESYVRQNRGIFGAEMAAARVRSVFLPLVDLTELAGTLTVVGLGVWALHTERLTLGGLLAFLTLLAQCQRPIRDLASLLPSLYSASAGVERIVELLDEQPATDRPGAHALSNPTGRVELDAVTVTYPGTSRPALRDVSLRAEPGEVVALCGPSGAGKSTVVRLLTRHLDPDGGAVTLDGHRVEELTVASVRDAITVVLQETMVMDASVHDNIAFGRPRASRSEVEAAARAADVHDFVMRMPEGYDSRIGQRGRSLSGGQRQRIALARALMRSSPVLVLDEPTNGLDPETAERALAPLRSAFRERTVLLITHDPVALAFADRVVYLADGAVVAPRTDVTVTDGAGDVAQEG